jgi:hypothetical protein
MFGWGLGAMFEGRIFRSDEPWGGLLDLVLVGCISFL